VRAVASFKVRRKNGGKYGAIYTIIFHRPKVEIWQIEKLKSRFSRIN
jgi:hypothetical protein